MKEREMLEVPEVQEAGAQSEGPASARFALREATADLHRRLDSLPPLQALLRPDLTPPAYAALLQRKLQWYRPTERAVAERLGPLAPADLPRRAKSHLLADDLQSLDRHTAVPEIFALPPRLSEPREALGALYVLEGATLGGTTICRRIRATRPDLPTAFFDAYGSDRGRLWQAFVAHLDASLPTAADRAAAIRGAAATFASLHGWLAPLEGRNA